MQEVIGSTPLCSTKEKPAEFSGYFVLYVSPLLLACDLPHQCFRHTIGEKHLLVVEVKEFTGLCESTLLDKRLCLLFAVGGEAFAHLVFQPFQVDAPVGAQAEHDVFVVKLFGCQFFFFEDTLRVIANEVKQSS